MKKEFLNLGQKLLYLGIVRLKFEKNLLLHLKQPRIFQNIKFHAELKILKLGPKLLVFQAAI